jgi:hypothetical protein
MGRPIKTAKSSTVDTGYGASQYGVVGGNSGIAGNQIACLVKIGTNAEAPGWIIRQKGARKFLVTDGTNTGVCALANSAPGALLDGEMTIEITKLDTTTANLAKFGTGFGVDFTGTGYYLTFGAAAAVPAGGIYQVAQVAAL